MINARLRPAVALRNDHWFYALWWTSYGFALMDHLLGENGGELRLENKAFLNDGENRITETNGGLILGNRWKAVSLWFWSLLKGLEKQNNTQKTVTLIDADIWSCFPWQQWGLNMEGIRFVSWKKELPDTTCCNLEVWKKRLLFIYFRFHQAARLFSCLPDTCSNWKQ